MSPEDGCPSASSSRMTVDFPEPDGPMRKTNSPLSILTDTLSSAGRADDLYCLDTWSRVIIGYLRRGSPWLRPREQTPLLLICVGDPRKGWDPLVVCLVWPRSGPCARRRWTAV